MSNRLYTYNYSPDYHPAMPVVEVGLSIVGQSKAQQSLMALIDSGSDGTLLPLNILEEVGARYVGDARIRGITGHTQFVDVYIANLHIGSHTLRAVRLVGVEDEEAILGRNVLNQLTITLDGVAGVTEIRA